MYIDRIVPIVSNEDEDEEEEEEEKEKKEELEEEKMEENFIGNLHDNFYASIVTGHLTC